MRPYRRAACAGWRSWRQAASLMPVEDELSQDDRIAVGWAVSTPSPTGQAVAERVRRGEKGLSVGDLFAIRQEWEAAGRPAH